MNVLNRMLRHENKIDEQLNIDVYYGLTCVHLIGYRISFKIRLTAAYCRSITNICYKYLAFSFIVKTI